MNGSVKITSGFLKLTLVLPDSFFSMWMQRVINKDSREPTPTCDVDCEADLLALTADGSRNLRHLTMCPLGSGSITYPSGDTWIARSCVPVLSETVTDTESELDCRS
jgi:hypothetical protein